MMRIFRYLPPSPAETKAFYVFAVGAFLGQLMAFVLALAAPTSGAQFVAVGGGLAILFRFGLATWQFDSRRRRAQKASIELEGQGVRFTNDNGQGTFIRFDEIEKAESKNGRLQLEYKGKKFGFGAREVENGMVLTQEIMRRVAKPNTPSNYIPLDAI
ncbi:MAG TPA: hypothetical protein VF627_10155 [Abditibacterium sp.]|jgi:hypothetical protein